MSATGEFELVLLLLTAAIALTVLAARLRLPPAAALVLGGMALALIPGGPAIDLDPDLVMMLFLPPLLLASAYFTAWREFRAQLRPILLLAVGAVLFTTLAVGVVAHALLPALPWAVCFALGAIVSPPDAVSAKAILQRLPLPRRMLTILVLQLRIQTLSGPVVGLCCASLMHPPPQRPREDKGPSYWGRKEKAGQNCSDLRRRRDEAAHTVQAAAS